jgi:Zn-dependent peptidase ImmA (M78 family)
VVETKILPLDRMAIEEAGPNPNELAAAIHAQLGLKTGAVPVHAIARALDIVDIRQERLHSIEGALVMTPDRNNGAILTNANSSLRRRRFTIAHELGHFLNQWHEPPNDKGFACTTEDLGTGWRGVSRDAGQHRLQESQANRFAIELLAPASRVEPFLKAIPDLEQVIAVSVDLDISKEAAARRYVELCERPIAVVFGHKGIVRYVERHPLFPFISRTKGDPLPSCQTKPDASGLTGHIHADPSDWLAPSARRDLLTQWLVQAKGYSMTLLMLDDDDEDEGLELQKRRPRQYPGD